MAMPLLRGTSSALKLTSFHNGFARRYSLHPAVYAENSPLHVKVWFPAFGLATVTILAYAILERTCFMIRKLWVEGTIWRLPPGCYHVSERAEWFRRHNAGIPPTSMQAIPGFTVTPPPLSVHMKLPGDGSSASSDDHGAHH